MRQTIHVIGDDDDVNYILITDGNVSDIDKQSVCISSIRLNKNCLNMKVLLKLVVMKLLNTSPTSQFLRAKCVDY